MTKLMNSTIAYLKRSDDRKFRTPKIFIDSQPSLEMTIFNARKGNRFNSKWHLFVYDYRNDYVIHQSIATKTNLTITYDSKE